MRTTRSVTIGRTADIKPGDLSAFDVEGVRIFAIDDNCTHEQCSLAARAATLATSSYAEEGFAQAIGRFVLRAPAA